MWGSGFKDHVRHTGGPGMRCVGQGLRTMLDMQVGLGGVGVRV